MHHPLKCALIPIYIALLVSSPAFAKKPAHDIETGASHKTIEIQKAEKQKLHKIFEDSEEAKLQRNPLTALYRGDLRYADQFGDYLSDAFAASEKKSIEYDLARLETINYDNLSPTDQLAYKVFKYNLQQSLVDYLPEYYDSELARPINHFTGFHTFYPNFASGGGAAPFNTMEDYENNLKRHDGFIRILKRSIKRMREGMASGIFETKLTIGNVIEQLDTQINAGVENSLFTKPIHNFPDTIDKAQRPALVTAYMDKTEEILSVYAELRNFLHDEYMPVARAGAGLKYMKNGDRIYRRLIEETTSLPLDPEDVHQLGLREVARILGDFNQIRQEVGFKGNLQEFFHYLRTSPEFQPKSRESLTKRYYRIGQEVDKRIKTLFKTLPKAGLEIRPYDKSIEKFQAGGSYQGGTADGSRPGVFYFNAYDLPSRSIAGVNTLYLHEGAPGHHFQISLAQENENLPSFMRYEGNTAYIEGWALYSEKLGFDMGLYDDPYQRFGHFDDEMLRAMRLVVDTGIHYKGWTREQAIQYMLDNSSMGETDATAEVERYIAIPSQALAYKIGALKIMELKMRAQKTLNERFDPREFHDQVLNTGALPMTIFEEKINQWIKTEEKKHMTEGHHRKAE